MTQNQVGPDPLLMGVREAAHALGIGRDLAYALVREGRLPSIRVGRRLLVPRRSLEAWIDEELRAEDSLA